MPPRGTALVANRFRADPVRRYGKTLSPAKGKMLPDVSTVVPGSSPNPAVRKRSFRAWRRSRPFWGGVFTLLAAIELYGVTAAPVSLKAIQGVAFASAAVIALMLVVLAVSTWAQPHLRTVTGPSVIILSLGSLLLANLGGFLLGMFLGVIGGGLMFSWTPAESPAAEPPAAPVSNGDAGTGSTAAGNLVTGAAGTGQAGVEPAGGAVTEVDRVAGADRGHAFHDGGLADELGLT